MKCLALPFPGGVDPARNVIVLERVTQRHCTGRGTANHSSVTCKLVTSHGIFIITVFLDPDKNKYFDGVLVLYMVSFKLFNNSWVWGRKRGLVSRDTPHFTSFLTVPSFSLPASTLFVKIKSIVAVGLCCILRKGG